MGSLPRLFSAPAICSSDLNIHSIIARILWFERRPLLVYRVRGLATAGQLPNAGNCKPPPVCFETIPSLPTAVSTRAPSSRHRHGLSCALHGRAGKRALQTVPMQAINGWIYSGWWVTGTLWSASGILVSPGLDSGCAAAVCPKERRTARAESCVYSRGEPHSGGCLGEAHQTCLKSPYAIQNTPSVPPRTEE